MLRLKDRSSICRSASRTRWLGIAVAHGVGWGLNAGLVFGLALSVASTVVLIRGLMDRQALGTTHGHVAVGWLIVEDLFTVLILVLLPVVVGPQAPGARGIGLELAIALGKLALLVGIVLVVGGRVVPYLLVRVARMESRELFTLAVLAIALGIAYGSAALFGVSMALGAFLAGLAIGPHTPGFVADAQVAAELSEIGVILLMFGVGLHFSLKELLAVRHCNHRRIISFSIYRTLSLLRENV